MSFDREKIEDEHIKIHNIDLSASPKTMTELFASARNYRTYADQIYTLLTHTIYAEFPRYLYEIKEYASSAIIAKDGKPLFLCSVRPDFKVRFSLNSKIYIALSEFEITDPFFDAATLSRIPVGIDYEGQQYLTIVLSENEITGAVDINYDFFRFEN